MAAGHSLPTFASFGEMLHYLRRSARLTQRDLAIAVGYSESMISRMEHDERPPDVATILALFAPALGVAGQPDVVAQMVTLADVTRRKHAEGSQPDAQGRPPPSTRHRLPVRMTSFVGREDDVLAVAQQLAQARLVTLTGPGGIGKTSLALQVATSVLDQFGDGVYFVALAAISDPDQVGATIAQTVGVREAPGRSFLESLQEHWRDKQLLLVLDNFEQILASARLVSALLNECCNLKVLVTSRSPLHLSGEHEFSVPPLALPDAKQLATIGKDPVASLAAFPAIMLFCQRAKAVKFDFSLTADNATDVAKICIDLDGLPLALELAAARIKLFSPSALLARLDQRLSMLTGGPRDLPARQRTLRDEIAWSYDLLAAREQMLFRRLAVFVDGFSLDAAHAVANAGRDLGIDFLDGITTLLDQNLVKSLERPDGEARLGMLEMIREYGLEQLEAAGEAAKIRRDYVTYYLALAEATAPALQGAGQTAGLAQLTRENANLQIALAWSHSEEPTGQVALRLASALGDYWLYTGRWREARNWLNGALAQTTTTQRTELMALALSCAGGFAYMQGDISTARPQLEAATDIAREVAAHAVLADSLLGLSWLALERQEHALSTVYLEEALAIARTLDDKFRIGGMLVHLGSAMCEQQEYVRAQVLYEEGLALFIEVGLEWDTADTYHLLGQAARLQGDHQRALTLFREGLAHWRALGVSQWGWIAECLDGVAMICIPQRHLVEAGRLAGAADALRNLVGIPAFSPSRSAFTGDFSAVRSPQDQAVFGAAWSEGRALSSEEAMDYALALPDVFGAAAPAVSEPIAAVTPTYPADLTGREVEVLRLLAQGFTYAEIAATLVVTARTVNGHVTSIYSKLGVNRRAAATRWAAEHHLV